MKPTSAHLRQLEIVRELREALALIHDFCLENSSAQEELMGRLRNQILGMDRRYGHLESWHRSGAGSEQSDGS